MIARANIDEITKAIINLWKLVLYLFLHLHIVGCYMWIATGYNAPREFIKDPDSVPCKYIDSNGEVLKIKGTDELFPCNEYDQ